MFNRLLEFIKENKTSEFLQAWEETQAGIDSLLTEVDDEWHGTLLHWACIKGNIEILHALLEAGASPDTQDSIGRTPLHYACRHGFDKAVELLLERVGSNRDLLLLQDNATKTALSLSVKYNYASVMLLFLREGIETGFNETEIISYLEQNSSSRSELLIQLINHLLQSTTDTAYNKIRKIIVAIKPETREWSRVHFNNFLGDLLSDGYSSDSDQSNDSTEEVDTQLVEDILSSTGNNKKKELHATISDLAIKARDQQLKPNSIKDFNDSAQDRQAYFPINSGKINGRAKIIENELKKITKAFDPKSSSRIRSKISGEKNKIYIVKGNDEYQLQHDYYLPLFRGISYLVDRWGAVSRRTHRRLSLQDELIHYSESVVQTMDNDFYQLDGYANIDRRALHRNARELKTTLLDYKRSPSVILNKNDSKKGAIREFDNFVHCLQYSFSNGIENFLQHLAEFNKQYPGIFPNSYNPFVPLSHLPFHAVRYAFGDKKPYRYYALPPLWDQQGRAMKPHIGKLYIFLHKLEDFLSLDEPDHMPLLGQTTGVTAPKVIGSEYEISFLSHTKKERLFSQRIIRYPNFDYDYAFFNTVAMLSEHDRIPRRLGQRVIALQQKKQGSGHRIYAYWLSSGEMRSNHVPKSEFNKIVDQFPMPGHSSGEVHLIQQVVSKFGITYDKTDKYLEKYGLTWHLFTIFKAGICNPDTQDETTEVLREWLFLFHAIKAMYEAEKEIVARGGVCIFRHPDGSFQLDYPSEAYEVNQKALRESFRSARNNFDGSERVLIDRESYGKPREFSVVSDSIGSPMFTPAKEKVSRKSFSTEKSSGYSSVSSKSARDDDDDALGRLLEGLSISEELRELDKIKEESRLTSEEEGVFGPRSIDAFRLEDVSDNGNCFYLAVIKQMELINDTFIETIPEGTLPHDSLRLRLQDRNFRDGEWVDTNEIFEAVRQFNVVIAIIDTRTPELGFRSYFLNTQEEVAETHIPDEVPVGRDTLRLAFTGNHYLSVQSHPELATGALRRAFGASELTTANSFWRREVIVTPNKPCDTDLYSMK